MRISSEHLVGRYYNNGLHKELEVVKVLQMAQNNISDTARYFIVNEGKSTSYKEITATEFKELEKNPLS